MKRWANILLVATVLSREAKAQAADSNLLT